MPDVRATLLAVVEEKSAETNNVFREADVLVEARTRLGANDLEAQHALLDAWHDLYRIGLITWGGNVEGPPTPSGSQIGWDRPSVHLTTLGRRTLEHVSRDPANPQGYLAHIGPIIQTTSVAYSYIEEAARTYAACCDKATAVLVGGAAESLALELRDALVVQLTSRARKNAKLETWKIKQVLDAIEVEIRAVRTHMPNDLFERFESFWGPLTGHLRRVRNDVGHPNSVAPVTRETVHGALLVFPEQARLAVDLRTWVVLSYPP